MNNSKPLKFMPDIFKFNRLKDHLQYEDDFIVLINGEGIEIMLHATKEEIAKFDGYNVHDGLIELPNFITDDEIADDPIYEDIDRWHPTDMAVLRYLRANGKDATIRFDGASALSSVNVKVLHQAILSGIKVEVIPKHVTDAAITVKQLAKEYLKP